MPNTRAAALYMIRAHCGEANLVHKGPVETLARSREWVWIVRGKNLSKTVCSRCPICIRSKKKLCMQRMAQIKPQNVEICKPWTFVSLDFAGPVVVKGIVNARARLKCWILVYVCRNTKAVCLLATSSYDTSSFLLRHEEFVARNGAPKEIVSDCGSQLVAASMVIDSNKTPKAWDWSKVEQVNSCTSWVLIPVGSPHHNGLPESMVKALKKSLVQTLHPGLILTYDELVTLLARISSSVNSRPLGLGQKSSSDQQEDLLPLTPNDMLLGRCSPIHPPMQYSVEDKFSQRVAFVNAVEQEWWKRWKLNVLPTLFPARKWRKKEENLVVGDIVLLLKEGLVKDNYTLARVSEVFPDSDGLVRRVEVKYRRRNMKEPSDMCRADLELKEVAVQNLALVVAAPRT